MDFTDNEQTILWRKNLRIINECLSSHWVDVDMSDAQWDKMQKVIIKKKERNRPVHLNRRILFRIFSNGSFKEGGRFYRAWWQEIPSPYRSLITVNGTRTEEYDYSNLNPTMMYALAGRDFDGDAYDIGLGDKHRDIVKQAFNAMLQADTQLNQKPDNINIEEIGMSWRELKEAILDTHKPIQDKFFKGIGNRLQFEDSCIAENVMLQFTGMNAPALPIHDSFIMHHGYSSYGELEEAMRRAYHDRFKTSFKDNRELIKEVIHEEKKEEKPENSDPNNIQWDNIDFDHLLEKEKEYSKWNERNDDWLSKTYPKR